MKNVLFLFLFFCSSIVYSQEDYNPEQLVIDGFECKGNSSTDCDIIEREIYLRPGDSIDEGEIQSAKIRLQLLALFRNVNISLKKSEQRGHVIVQIEVEEDDHYFTEFNNNLYLGSDDYITSFKLGNRNMFGRGKILQGTVTTGKLYDPNQLYSVNLKYIDPHLLGSKRYFFQTEFEYAKKECQDQPNSFYCQREQVRGSFNIGRRIFDYSYIQIGIDEVHSEGRYRPLVVDTNNIFVPGDVQDTNFRGGRYLLTYGWNSEDDVYFATQGSKFDLLYSRSRRIEGTDFLNLNYKKNWMLSSKHLLLGTLGSSFTSDSLSSTLVVTPGLQYVYQPRRFQSGKDVTDLRFFVGNEAYLSDYTTTSSFTNFKAGVLFNSKTFGIVQLNVFARNF